MLTIGILHRLPTYAYKIEVFMAANLHLILIIHMHAFINWIMTMASLLFSSMCEHDCDHVGKESSNSCWSVLRLLLLWLHPRSLRGSTIPQCLPWISRVPPCSHIQCIFSVELSNFISSGASAVFCPWAWCNFQAARPVLRESLCPISHYWRYKPPNCHFAMLPQSGHKNHFWNHPEILWSKCTPIHGEARGLISW